MNPLILVEADYGSIGRSFVETDRDKNSWDQVIESIATGQYLPVKVLEIYEDEGSCRDVTEDIARDVFEFFASNHEGAPNNEQLRDWLDHWVGAGACDVLNSTAGRREDVYEREPA
jgi:hypothetical protein